MKLAMICQTRTGSQLLKTLLNSHPAVQVYPYEAFYPVLREGGFYKFWADRVAEDPKSIILSAHMNDLLREWADSVRAMYPGKRVIGYDIKLEQIEWLPKGRKLLRSIPFSYLHLIRRNRLRSIVSEAVMYKRIAAGDTQVHRDKVPEIETVELAADRVVEKITKRIDLDAEAERLFGRGERPYMQVYYEDLADEHTRDDTLDEIFQFAGVNPSRATKETSLKKQNPHALSDLIENYQAIERALRGTPHESMLAEGV
ncbi:MAG: hypothetical protein AAF108_08345 [Planctomycetota bacterium]